MHGTLFTIGLVCDVCLGTKGQCLVKNRFCPVKPLDGQTMCPVIYACKEKFNAELQVLNF